jgi:hypothetical protein
MPDGTINVYVDSSFFSVVSGTEDIHTSFIAGQLENIGLRDTVAEYQTQSSISGVIDQPVEVYITYSGALQEGFNSTAVSFKTDTSLSGNETCLVDYSVFSSSSGTEDVASRYFTGISKISGSIGAKIQFTAGNLYDNSDNILNSYWTFASTSGYNDYEIDYTAGGEYDPLIPGPPENQIIISGTGDIDTEFTAADDDDDGAISAYCDVTFVGYPIEFHPNKYTYKFDSVAGLEGDKQGADWETTVISGSVLDVPLDVFSTATTSGYYNSDEICGLVDSVSYAFNSEVVSGTISYYFHDVVCGASGTGGYGFDIDLFSLKISNFSLDVDEYTAASGMICVDLTDDVHNVVISGSYFIIGENVVSGTSYIPITDGYTMCYDSPTDFDTLVGSTTVTVHAANDNGQILEQDFYLTSGYIVEYDNRTQDYGFNSQVVVRGQAENMASCPNTGTDAYFFTTTPRIGADLGASIVGQPWSEGNLTAEITPTTDTVYFYGKVFRIEVRAKDFAGNVMEPFVFEFRIEDKPE